MTLRIVQFSDKGLWNQCEELEASVFIESGYIEHTGELIKEYAPYNSTSIFAAVEEGGQICGCARLIGPSDAGFKTLTDLSEGRLDLSPFGREVISLARSGTEVGTIAVTSGYRQRPHASDRVAFQLYAAVVAHAERHDAQWVWASFDENYYERYKSIFGESAKALGEPTMYMGSPTVAVGILASEWLRDFPKKMPDLYTVLRGLADDLDIP